MEREQTGRPDGLRRVKAALRRRINGYVERTGRRLWAGRPSLDARTSLLLLRLFSRRPPRHGAPDPAQQALLSDGESAERRAAFLPGGLIGTQKPLCRVPYGRRGNSADHGCGWIAAYNALCLLGETPDPAEVLSAVSRGARRGGTFGTDPFFLERYFRARGYKTAVATERRAAEALCRGSDAFIWCYLWISGGQLGGHFAAGCRDRASDGFLVYNGEHGGEARAETLEAIDADTGVLRIVLGLSKALFG